MVWFSIISMYVLYYSYLILKLLLIAPLPINNVIYQWPGYDEWVYTSFLTPEPSSLLGHRRARPSTKRQLAISLAAAIQLFHEDRHSLLILSKLIHMLIRRFHQDSRARPYDPAQAGGCMAWQLSYFGYERLVLRQLRYLSPGRWEIEVVASSDSLVASSSVSP